jgi:N-acetyl-gamma-glutamyl-phosphate reductase
MDRKKLFIDGESGTTGLRIFSRLGERSEFEIIRLPTGLRKDAGARRAALNACDLAVLCLPDEAALEAVAMVENPAVKVLDASCAHRTAPDWTYGFAELTSGQGERIAGAMRVTNPGCYATAAVAILRPLVEAGLLPDGFPVTLNAVSGYSGGGKALIAAFEDPTSPDYIASDFYEYGLSFEHKHVPEIWKHSGLRQPPLFVPSVGRFAQGLIVNFPIQLWALPERLDGRDLHGIYRRHYGQGQVRVAELREESGRKSTTRIEADALNGTDMLAIQVFHNPRTRQALVAAQLDNLGKGACGAAIQNLELMLALRP